MKEQNKLYAAYQNINYLNDAILDEDFPKFCEIYNNNFALFNLDKKRINISYYKRRERFLSQIIKKKLKYLRSKGYSVSRIVKVISILNCDFKLSYILIEKEGAGLYLNPFICSYPESSFEDIFKSCYNKGCLSMLFSILEKNVRSKR